MGFKLNLSDKTKGIISTVAPTLGAALGGPLGALAGNVIAAAVGSKDSKAVEDALLTQKPETLLALRKAEQDFTIQLENLGVERDRIAMADRVSARDLAKVDMRPQMILSTVFIGGYFGLLALLMLGSVILEGVAKEQFPILLGVLTAGIPMVLQFWFGTSSGSQVKSFLLQQSRPANGDDK